MAIGGCCFTRLNGFVPTDQRPDAFQRARQPLPRRLWVLTSGPCGHAVLPPPWRHHFAKEADHAGARRYSLGERYDMG